MSANAKVLKRERAQKIGHGEVQVENKNQSNVVKVTQGGSSA